MSSRIKHIVEPAVGWLFVAVLIFAVVAALLAATRPMVEVTGRMQMEKAH